MPPKKEWKWGYISKNGEFVIAPSFDDAWPFHEGLAAVKVEWARGYIDKTGSFVITPKFEKAGPFIDGVAEVVEDGETRYINHKGEAVDAPSGPREDPYASLKADQSLLKTYFEAGTFSEGLAPFKKSASAKWGYLDEAGKVAIKPSFRQAGEFHDGLAAVLTQV